MEWTTLYFLVCLFTTTVALPLTSSNKVTRELGSNGKNILTRAMGDQGDAKVKTDEGLLERKNILEEMLKDTNDKLSQKDKIESSKRYIAMDPLLRYPTKKSTLVETNRGSVVERTLDDEYQAKPITSTEEIERLQKVLKKLTDRFEQLKSEGGEATLPRTPAAQSQDSSRTSLMKKLKSLDVDLHQILGTDSNHGLDKAPQYSQYSKNSDDNNKESRSDIYRALLAQMRD